MVVYLSCLRTTSSLSLKYITTAFVIIIQNLEKYAVNLEKNQRFESLRSSKAQREMRETCQQLLDKIRELEQTVQVSGKQKTYNKPTLH